MANRFLVFDLDGTLLYTLPSILWALNQTLAPYGKGGLSLSQCRAFVGEGSGVLIHRSLAELGLLSLGPEKEKEMLKTYNEAYLASPFEGTSPYPGMRSLIKERKEKGDQLGVFSNKPDFICRPILRHFFPEDPFDFIRGAQEGKPKKPEPSGLFEMMEEMGQEKQTTLYIGDSLVDARLGKAAGVRTFLVSYGYQDREPLEKTGFLLLDSVEELGKALRESEQKLNEK